MRIPEVTGSNPVPATKKVALTSGNVDQGHLLFLNQMALLNVYSTKTLEFVQRKRGVPVVLDG